MPANYLCAENPLAQKGVMYDDEGVGNSGERECGIAGGPRATRSGVSICASVRDPDRAAEKLGDGVELAVGNFLDTASLRRALEGMDHLFLMSADSPHKVDPEIAVIDAATTENPASRLPSAPRATGQKQRCKTKRRIDRRSARTLLLD